MVAGEPLTGAPVRDLANVDREHLAAGPLDAVHHLGLGPERAQQPVEVGSDHDVSLAGLDGLDCPGRARALVERPTARDVEFVNDARRIRPSRSPSP